GHPQTDAVESEVGPGRSGRLEEGVDLDLPTPGGAEAALPLREVHPGQPGVELRAEEVGWWRRRGVMAREELLDPLLEIRHAASSSGSRGGRGRSGAPRRARPRSAGCAPGRTTRPPGSPG